MQMGGSPGLPLSTHHFCQAGFLEDSAWGNPAARRASLSCGLLCKKKDKTSLWDGPPELKFPSGSSKYVNEWTLHCMHNWHRGKHMVSAPYGWWLHACTEPVLEQEHPNTRSYCLHKAEQHICPYSMRASI